MKVVYTGLESSGKSLMLSKMAYKVLKRNVRWLKIRKRLKLPPIPRTMAFNQPMSESFKKLIKANGIKYLEWRDFNDIELLTESDIFIDELLKIFPTRGVESLPPHQMDFLTQGAKSGNHIFATSQDFSQVHKQFRLLTNKVYVINKLMGSRRPMKSMPPISFIWGLCIRRSVKPQSFKGDNSTFETKFIPIPFLISKADTLRYDTIYKVPRGVLPDLKLRKQRIYAEDENGHIIYDKIQFK